MYFWMLLFRGVRCHFKMACGDFFLHTLTAVGQKKCTSVVFIFPSNGLFTFRREIGLQQFPSGREKNLKKSEKNPTLMLGRF